jgi:hypothetical protein
MIFLHDMYSKRRTGVGHGLYQEGDKVILQYPKDPRCLNNALMQLRKITKIHPTKKDSGLTKKNEKNSNSLE